MVYIQSPDVSIISPNRPTHPRVIQYDIYQATPSMWPYYAEADIPTLSSLLTVTTDVDAYGTTSVQDVVVSTNLPIPSLVQITALPPATTSPQVVLTKLPYSRHLNVLYLVPLFVALGVVLGSLTAASILKCRDNRRRFLRSSSLLPGPPYAPTADDVEDRLLVHGQPSMEEVSLFATATPSKYTVHGSRYTPKRAFAWQTSQPPLSQPTHTHTIIPSSDGERFTVVATEDPFLATSPIGVEQASESSNEISLPQIRVSRHDLTSQSNSDHKGNDLPKPFRRSMFDILRLKGSPRQLPGARKKYTVVPVEERAEKDLASEAHRVSSVETGEFRSQNVRLSLDGDFNFGDMEDALGLFNERQDLADVWVPSPEQIGRSLGGTSSSPTKMGQLREITSLASESNRTPKDAANGVDESTMHGRDEPDIYTAVPKRRPSRTSRKSTGSSRRSSAPDTHASVLPLSPPSLMSPPLEKSLFFTTSLSSSASLASRVTTLDATHSLKAEYQTPDHSLFPLPSRQTNKLRSKRPEPSLPCPSYPDLVHGRSSSPVDVKQRPVSPGSPKPKGRLTSATQWDSATGIWSLGSLSQTSLAAALASSSSFDALTKVNDIVAQGYTKKRAASVGAEDGNVPSDSV